MSAFVLLLLAAGAGMAHGFRESEDLKVNGELSPEHSLSTSADHDIQDFVMQIFTDVVQPGSRDALRKACDRFGNNGTGKLMWTLFLPPEDGEKTWSCDDPVDDLQGTAQIKWRQTLIENYVYCSYHLIEVSKDDNVDFGEYKESLKEALRPFKDTVFSDVQSHTRHMLMLSHFFKDSVLMDQVQDFRYMRFYLVPLHHNRRLSINVPTSHRPGFVACAIEKLLITEKVSQMKVSMVHAMDTQNYRVPYMASDNVILYLLEKDDINAAVSETQKCLDETVGPFDRRGPRCMKRMGEEGQTGANIYAAADDYNSGISPGHRLGKFFGEGYLRMIQRDDPGAQDPGCLRMTIQAIAQLAGKYNQQSAVGSNERVTGVRFAEGLAGALRKVGLKNGLDGLFAVQ